MGVPTAQRLALDEIQGNILRGYHADSVTHLAVRVPDAGLGRRLLSRLCAQSGDDGASVTMADSCGPEADYCLNIGLTYDGLRALGTDDSILAEFPEAFRQGAAARSAQSAADNGVGLGDVGDSDPARWIVGGDGSPPVHLLLSLWTVERSPASLQERLRDLIVEHRLEVVASVEGRGLPGGRVHFGYRDGISHVHVDGAPGLGRRNLQPPAPTGDFLLGCGYTNSYGGNFQANLPDTLADNATYAVLRIMRQDVGAFEEVLDRTSARLGIHREAVAAQLMGRWRDGTPLSLMPTTAPRPAIPDDDLDAFDYAPAPERGWLLDDPDGSQCPVGAHIRRMNPRGSLVIGQPHARRLIRRGMPYGPEFRPGQPDASAERGLIGYFICGDIEMQYEFVLRVWANQDLATHGLRGTRDPIIGFQPDGGGNVRLANPPDTAFLDGLPRLVHTRGSLYLFMPGARGLTHLASA
jgi:deferrochelatase/peroxidase EfeB